MKVQRMAVIKLHVILACLFIPMATLYFVSGALYTFDIKGKIDKQVYDLPLAEPFTPDLERLSELARTALEQRNQALPRGESTIRNKDGSYEYRWGDLRRLVVIHQTANPLQVELVYRQRNPLAQIMRVHRAEAGLLPQLFSFSMAVSLLTILASGIFLAVGLPKLRRTAWISLAAGFVILLPVFM
jgi:hypothetical protein